MTSTQQSSEKNRDENFIPEIIIDHRHGHSYTKGRFLGKGGFARCYELTDVQTSCVFAGKIVSKALLTKSHQQQKMVQEIDIHRKLKHPNIVRFHNFFEDDNNVYILLEICRRRSLMELQKRRKLVTEPEARYFLHQITDALEYLHKCKVIHRDLKLGNLFISEDMVIKVGDFGLATQLEYEHERKRTMCGTPNYIAPEVLTKAGHSFEVDIWSLGCILYTLLMGRPPFETNTLKDTYMRIKNNDYYLPAGSISTAADVLIRAMLHREPCKRPTVAMIKNSAFLVEGYRPTRLPASCCSIAPRHFDTNGTVGGSASTGTTSTVNAPISNALGAPAYAHPVLPHYHFDHVHRPVNLPNTVSIQTRRPLLDFNKESENLPPLLNPILPASLHRNSRCLPPHHKKENNIATAPTAAAAAAPTLHKNRVNDPTMIEILAAQIKGVLTKYTISNFFLDQLPEEAQDPSRVPFLWISRWVDYSDKYGLGYQLCDDSVGIIFNDSTHLIQPLVTSSRLQYIDRDGLEYQLTMDSYPEIMFKKVTLFRFFKDYMDTNLVKTGRVAPNPQDEERLARVPFLKSWFRTRNAIVLHLSNGILQVNFFRHHTKYILCPVRTMLKRNRV